MKILKSIQRAYNDQLDVNKKLESKVDDIFKNNKEGVWHFEHRIKPLESFALKIEGGRFENPNKLEDFLACTLVVRNLKEIDKAIDLVKNFFDITNRRPPVFGKTHKKPDSFPF